jgi:hypothetical protein
MGPRLLRIFLAACAFLAVRVDAQPLPPFNIEAYRTFLNAHQDMSSADLLALHPVGAFAKSAHVSWATTFYADSIDRNYALTPYEKSLLEAHGFVVTERLSMSAMSAAFRDIYHRDLPLYISSDAILHAFHLSYDALLEDVEVTYLSTRLDSLLRRLHLGISELAVVYQEEPAMGPMLRDVDLYLTVSRALLDETGAVTPVFSETAVPASDLLALVAGEMPAQYPLFGLFPRTIDFSQFTPRGHYTDSKLLQRYFKTLMWLGRTEFWLRAPQLAGPHPDESDIHRQVVDAALIDEAAGLSGAAQILNDIEEVLRFFVGEVDNVSLPALHGLLGEDGIASASDLLDSTTYATFCADLLTKSWAFQQINSQILMSDPLSPEHAQPAAAFLLIGQRFVIDSYVTGDVVFDKIIFEGNKMMRMLPSTLDVLYALGNDAAGQLLVPELDRYHYAENLAALRYLIDSYDATFWQSALYTQWLGAIRALNPPPDRSSLPPGMQSAAWWQMKISTQLASWAQLRHDNLLYAKQSYTSTPTCSYPVVYVEPVPHFFAVVRTLADSAAARFREWSVDGKASPYAAHFFETMRGTLDTLATIAAEELAGQVLSMDEDAFLHRTMNEENEGCMRRYDGWYPRLYYGGFAIPSDRMVVADVHTSPADANGNPVGWVLHAGTGPVNMAVVVAPIPGRGSVAFVGPVLSSYEVVTENFRRLTDEEWQTAYAEPPSSRPSLVNLYLADQQGESRGEGMSLLTSVDAANSASGIPPEYTLYHNYPNPFNASTVISGRLSRAGRVKVMVHDLLGRVVATLADGTMSAGSFSFRFDGSRCASGVYYCSLIADGTKVIRPMVLVK